MDISVGLWEGAEVLAAYVLSVIWEAKYQLRVKMK